MAVTPPQLAELKTELDRLYKNFTFVKGRTAQLVESLRGLPNPHSDTDLRFWSAFREWQIALSYGSHFGDHVAKAIREIDPRWSQIWANYATLLLLDPTGNHSAPIISGDENLNPPSNRF